MRQTTLVLAPPIVWALQQQANYALTASACAARSEWWLHVTGLLALVLVAATTLLALSEHKRLSGVSSDQGETIATRSRFLAASGIGSGVFFLLVIVATDLPNWFLGACQQ